jgi:hypothetical protein
MKRLLLFICLVLLPDTDLIATTYVDCDFSNAPSSESNGGTYTGAVGTLDLRLQVGTPADMFDHVIGESCYGGSGGCAKFYPATAGAGGYRSLEPNYTGGAGWQNITHIRYLAKWNSTMLTNWRGFKSEIIKGNDSTDERCWSVFEAVGTCGPGGELDKQPFLEPKGTSYTYVHCAGDNSGCDKWCCSDRAECTTETATTLA